MQIFSRTLGFPKIISHIPIFAHTGLITPFLALFCSLFVSSVIINYISTINVHAVKIKMNTIDTVLIMSCMVLRDEFGFGQKRIKQFFDRFNLKTECICDGDVIWDDFIDALREETGIEFSIRENK